MGTLLFRVSEHESSSPSSGQAPLARNIWLITLSARNERDLDLRISDLHRWAQGQGRDISLDALSRTLNAGRKHHATRRCWIVESIDDLLTALARRGEDAVLSRTPAEGRWTPAEAIAALAAADKAQDRRLALEALGACYLDGADIDWSQIQAACEPIGDLPSYPFARTSFWVRQPETRRGQPLGAAAGGFWDRDVSTLGRQGFAKRIGRADAFGYGVRGTPLLHAASYIGLAVAALRTLGSDPASLRLRRCAWAQHLVLDQPQALAVWLQGDQTEADFEIALQRDGASEVLMQGVARMPAGPAPTASLPIASFDGDGAWVSKDGVFALLAGAGIEYDAAFRHVERVAFGDDAAFAEVAPQPATAEQALLAALQVLECWIARQSSNPAMVSRIGSMTLSGRLGAARHVRARRDGGGFEIVIADADGLICAAMEDVGVFPIGADNDGAEPVMALTHYEPRPLELRAPHPAFPGGVLLFDNDERLADAMREADPRAEVVVVLPGEGFCKTGAASYRIDPVRGADYRRLLDSLRQDGLFPSALVHRWAADAFSPLGAAMAAQLTRGVKSLFWLGKALLLEKWPRPARLVFWYRNRSGAAQPLSACAAGLLKTLTQESPQLTARVIDDRRSGDDARAAARMLADELGHWDDGDAEVRHDDGGRFCKTCGRLPAAAAAATVLRPRGVYLISGGLGGLGRLFAEHFASRGPVTLVLTGRSALSAERERELAGLTAGGSKLVYMPCDIADADSVRALVARIRAEHGPINGVLHAAGVLRDGWLADKSVDDFDAVLAPKVAGTVQLDLATRHEPLDFFIMFSSIVGVAGHAGQSDYAVANAFQLEFAELRNAQRATSERSGATRAIAWSYWRDGGMRMSGQDESLARSRWGLTPLATDAGLALFDRALCLDAPAVVAACGDPARISSILSESFHTHS
ncbi:SDR family NAD(P)-dependent oxidoreductase [Chromobacterium vaccinii]|uniref:SDR family oxidoreductase n=1 Tax=Chromobacterium vaccinii TaxID=1108595 RepID=UPI003C741111